MLAVVGVPDVRLQGCGRVAVDGEQAQTGAARVAALE